MSDPLCARYDAVPYRHGAIPDSHPARTGFIARLLGIPAAAPDGCRVLELGCGEAMNLLPLAERLPKSEFVGVDFSRKQIAAGEEARAACGIANTRLVCADLREFEPEPESFDYVIAHGVYSWIPDPVKERLLAICARALAPNGVAYVSYNTLPGWGMLAGLRRVLLAEVARESDPYAQLSHAARVLVALAQSLEGQPGAHAALVRETIAELRALPPELLFHDALAPVNDPCTFTEFTSHAARHSLHYLGEAHYATMPFDHVPAPARAALATLGLDASRGQQFVDVIFPRQVRTSLLTRAQVSEKGDLRAVQDCAIGSRFRLGASSVNLDPGVKLRLLGPNELAFEIEQPAEKALAGVLVQASPARIPFPDAVAQAHTILRDRGSSETADSQRLAHFLYRIFTLDAVDLLLRGSSDWLSHGAQPAPSPLMRFQAARGHPVTNRWHEPIALTGEAQRVIAEPARTSEIEALADAGLLV